MHAGAIGLKQEGQENTTAPESTTDDIEVAGIDSILQPQDTFVQGINGTAYSADACGNWTCVCQGKMAALVPHPTICQVT
jgi:hypothetical protein